jgi:hypothetical protein
MLRQWIGYAGFVGAVCGICFYGCGESDSLVKKKLDLICASDLNAITNDIPKTSLLKAPFYSIVSYKCYSEGMYSGMAIVDYYFLKTVKVKIVRKYRYYTSARLWDRYFNAYTFFGDTAQALPR